MYAFTLNNVLSSVLYLLHVLISLINEYTLCIRVCFALYVYLGIKERPQRCSFNSVGMILEGTRRLNASYQYQHNATPTSDMPLNLSAFWVYDTESRINELALPESI